MIETPELFGPEQALVGVLTRPDAGAALPQVAYLLFNAGVIPRIGTHRLNVKIARALGAQGQVVLRLDLSGQGDSRNINADGDFRAQAVRDLRAAMDRLEQTLGIRRFALIGLCSGAVTAYWASQADPRVAGVLMVDGLWYRSRWTAWVRHWKRFRGVPWRAVLAAVKRRLVPAAAEASGAAGLFDGSSEPANPPREDFCRAMQVLVDRRVAVFLLYGGSVIDYYSYASQFRHVFADEPWLSRVRCDFRPDIDHTFVAIEVQRRMVELVLGWQGEVRQACEPLP